MVIKKRSGNYCVRNRPHFEWNGILRSRVFWVLFAIIIPSLIKPEQSVSAYNACDLSFHIHFDDIYYQFTAENSDAKNPVHPVIKQQLEDLYNQGALTGSVESYGLNFSASLSLDPGTLYWQQWIPQPDKWVYNNNCTYFLEEFGECSGHWEKTPPICKDFSQPIYRSIKELRVFLIPDQYTVSWLEQLTQSPILRLAYPDFWEPIVVSGSVPISNWTQDQQGLHFLVSDTYSYPSLPTHLYVKPTLVEIPNSIDAGKITRQSVYVIAVCDAINGSILNYGKQIIDNNDLDYNCEKSSFEQNFSGWENQPQIQSITLSISNFFFDIPGNFAIGIAAIIDPAQYPDTGHDETIDSPETLYPTNIGDGSYMNKSFTVWMIVTTPCTTGMGDTGCMTYFTPQ